ncbi:signal peptidase I [Solitalea lacus]|uniref:signal peptidase I n=1 Tax=Solitalea lacus TaxID=2911172 RepID=UPI001EDA629D|nr:signal peptidase I [Solitalea lacus]UKJ08078.1 signal peptidase I [Solitalea lacus]
MKFFRKKDLKQDELPQQSILREWLGALTFALVMATIINTFFMQLYAVPTGSMEKSVYIGDRIYVSKLHYGARLPITPLSIPLMHNTLPLGNNLNSYFSGLQAPYFRLPGISSVQRGDVVVFNFPLDKDSQGNYRPIDKKENYVKRCVALPNDVLTIRNGKLFINSKPAEIKEREQMEYFVTTDGSSFSSEFLKQLDIRKFDGTPSANNDIIPLPDNQYFMFLSEMQAELLSQNPIVKKIQKHVLPAGERETEVFQPSNTSWNRDNYGPLTIPVKGTRVKLTNENLPLYKNIIEVYENNTLTVNDTGIFINGHKQDTYSFKLDYYFMMGDNRHNSEDSRSWGFVPEDHIVGKPLFVYLSFNERGTIFDKIRWNRIFKTIND